MAQHVAHNVATIAPRPGPAVVVSAGRMQNAVKVRQMKEVYNRHLRKSFYSPYHFLVNDPNSSLIEGDIITTTPERHSKHIKHTVDAIIAPFGKPIDERPPLYSAEQRAAIADTKRKAKVQRRASRGVMSAIQEARKRGWELETAATGGWGALHAESRQEGGHPEVERPKDAMGRSAVDGGGHRFGGKGEGGLHKEMMQGANRTLQRQEKAKEQETVRQEVENESTDDVAREHLEGKR